MDWKLALSSVLGNLPHIIMDVEATMGHQPGTTKKQAAVQLAMDGLGLTEAMLPQHADKIGAIATEAGNVVNSIVNIFHAAGLFQHKQAAAATPGS